MAVQLILKNSSVEDKRPTANQLANGEISLNYHVDGAFLCCRDTSGAIQQIGGVKISDTAPDNPVKQSQWFKPADLTLFIYDGANWLPIAGGGGGGGGGTGDISTIIGNDGIDASEIAGVVTLNVDLAGGDDGLEFKSSRLSASIATTTKLGSVKIGGGLDVAPDGTIGIDGDIVLQTGDIIGGDGIKVTDGTGTATVDVDLLGGQDGLEIKSNKLTASVATKSILGSVKIGDEITVDSDGTISGNPIVPPVISQDNAPDFIEDYIWFDTSTTEAYVGYKDPDDDEYWVSLTKVGLPGKDGKDGTPVVISQDTAPPFQEDAIWFDTSTGKAYFGYKDQDGDEYWISLTQVGPPGPEGKDGDPVVLSQDTAPPFEEDTIWFDTSSGKAYFGYLDPDGDGYWVSLTQPGPPGTPGINGSDGDPVVISQETAPPFQEDAIWFNTSNGEAYFGYKDPSSDTYWISLSKPGAPGIDGINADPVVISQDTAPAFQEDAIWFDTSSGKAYFGYKDQDGDEYWVSLTQVGPPGSNGTDGVTVIRSDSAPSSPVDGQIWVNTTTGTSYSYWSSQSVWVSM